MMRLLVLCVVFARAALVVFADEAALKIVGQHQAVFTEPPRMIPSNTVVDAPLMGNGDALAALGGGPERFQFYINKNDLWVMRADRDSRPLPLARLDVMLPTLQEGSYRVEQDLGRAITTGQFEKDGKSLTLETGVAATENLLWIKLSANGGDIKGKARLFFPTARAQLVDTTQAANIGREQTGEGRWYFQGEIADLVVTDKVLSGEPPRKPQKPETFDGRSTWRDLPVAPMKDTVSVAAWIKLGATTAGTDYILSKGEWNEAYSLGLTDGRLRWSINGVYLQTKQPLEKEKWLYVVGTYDNGEMHLYVNGKEAASGEATVTQRVGDVQVVERRFQNNVLTPSGAACAARVVGAGDEFTVSPHKPVLIVASICSRFDSPVFSAKAVERAAKFQHSELPALQKKHAAWWQAFWSKSFIEITDKLLEQRYYLSHYVMASASRVKDFPPGLFGWVTTDSPAWNGDYHLNYNHIAPFYALYAANHLEQADPCHEPLLANADQARELCRKALGIEGIYQYVGIGPLGSTAAPTAHMQKSNSSNSCVPLAFRWYATYDLEFGRQAYPFVRDVATFWENWLKYENNRYVIYNDAIHEGSGKDVNPILSLGLIRMVMELAIDMSRELGVDAHRQKKWQHICDHLSEFPRQKHGDKTIFRYSEQGLAWFKSNTLGIQHIYPAGAIGLASDPKLLDISKNTIDAMRRWRDLNGMNSIYAAAVRVGYDANIVLQEMRSMLEKSGLPNGMIAGNPHGIEQQSIVPNAIQEMLLQSHEGVLRLFPVWPKDQDARFGTLRARGAFLVSAEFKQGTVSGVTIISEKGRECSLQNPWPGKKVQLHGRETLRGERLIFRTTPGETIKLKPL